MFTTANFGALNAIHAVIHHQLSFTDSRTLNNALVSCAQQQCSGHVPSNQKMVSPLPVTIESKLKTENSMGTGPEARKYSLFWC